MSLCPQNPWNSYLQVQKEKHLPNEHSTTKFCSECHGWTDAGISTVWWPEVQIESVYHIFDNMFQDTHKSTNNYSNLWASSKLSISMNKPTNLLHSSCPFPLKRDWINHQVCGPQQSQEPQDVGIMPKIKGHDLISVEFTPKNKTVGSHEVLLTFTLGGFKTHLFIINGEELSSLEFLIVFIRGG